MVPSLGFTLIEVLVALAIVAVTLLAGLQATTVMSMSAERQSGRVLAQLCAENALAQVRMSRKLPDLGSTSKDCLQGGQALKLNLLVRPTLNTNFRRIEVRVALGDVPVLQLTTVLGRY